MDKRANIIEANVILIANKKFKKIKTTLESHIKLKLSTMNFQKSCVRFAREDVTIVNE
jgi:hypothetical protein